MSDINNVNDVKTFNIYQDFIALVKNRLFVTSYG